MAVSYTHLDVYKRQAEGRENIVKRAAVVLKDKVIHIADDKRGDHRLHIGDRAGGTAAPELLIQKKRVSEAQYVLQQCAAKAIDDGVDESFQHVFILKEFKIILQPYKFVVLGKPIPIGKRIPDAVDERIHNKYREQKQGRYICLLYTSRCV